MEKVRRNYPDILPALGVSIRSLRAGNMLFISGVTVRGSDAEDADLLGQTEAVLERLKRIMEAEGGTMQDIVKTTTFLTDIEEWREKREQWHQIIDRYFQGLYSTNSLMQVASLAFPYMRIEIEAIAML